MQESHGEGLASHTDPESCVAGRKASGEALTGAHAGQPSSREILISRIADAVIAGGRQDGAVMDGETDSGPARSQTLSTCGNSSHGNREIPQPPTGADGPAGRSQKATARSAT